MAKKFEQKTLLCGPLEDVGTPEEERGGLGSLEVIAI